MTGSVPAAGGPGPWTESGPSIMTRIMIISGRRPAGAVDSDSLLVACCRGHRGDRQVDPRGRRLVTVPCARAGPSPCPLAAVAQPAGRARPSGPGGPGGT